jgi:hypothetical protein
MRRHTPDRSKDGLTRRRASLLCCHRGALSTGAGARPQAARARSFVNHPGWREFQTVLAGLRRECPPALPVVVRASWLPETILGQCLRRDKRFVVQLTATWVSRRPSRCSATSGRTRWPGASPSTGSPRPRGSIPWSSTARAMTRPGAAPTRGCGGRIRRRAGRRREGATVVAVCRTGRA